MASVRVTGARVDITGSSAVFRRELKKSGQALRSNAKQIAASKRAYRSFTRQAQNTIRRLGSLRTATTGLVASGGAFILFSKRMADASAELVEAARTVNLTVESYQELARVFEADGVSATTFNKALINLQKNVTNAGYGLTTYTRALDAVGLSYERLRGLSAEQMLHEFADALSQTESETAKVSAVADLLGARQVAMIQVLDRGSASLHRQRRVMRGLGVVSNESAQAGKDVAQAYLDVGTAFRAAGQNIVGSNADSLIGFLQNVTALAPNAQDALIGLSDTIRGAGTAITGAFAGLVALNLTTSLAPILGPHGAVIAGLAAGAGVFGTAAVAIEKLTRAMDSLDVQRFGPVAVATQARIHELEDEIGRLQSYRSGFGIDLAAPLREELATARRELARIKVEGGVSVRPTAAPPTPATPEVPDVAALTAARKKYWLDEETAQRRLIALERQARIEARAARLEMVVEDVPQSELIQEATASFRDWARERAKEEERAQAAGEAFEMQLLAQKHVIAQMGVGLSHGVVDAMIEAVRTGESFLDILKRIVSQLGVSALKARLGEFITGKVIGVPGAASGGIASGVVRVGEEGEELVDFRRPARVHSAEDTAAALRGMGGLTYAPRIYSSDGPAVQRALRDGFEVLKREVRAELLRDLRRPGALSEGL